MLNVNSLREFSILRTDKCYILLLLLAYLLSQWTDPSLASDHGSWLCLMTCGWRVLRILERGPGPDTSERERRGEWALEQGETLAVAEVTQAQGQCQGQTRSCVDNT